jgi:hypothetical protein
MSEFWQGASVGVLVMAIINGLGNLALVFWCKRRAGNSGAGHG